MRAVVSWGTAGRELGFGQPQNVFKLFNRVVSNDDFTVQISTSSKFILSGPLAFEGIELDMVRLQFRGSGFTYDGGDPTGGTIKTISMQVQTETGWSSLFSMKKLDLDFGDLADAVDFEDNGGADDTVENLLYGDGWIYNGTPSVDIIDPQQNFFGFGTSFQMTGRDKINTGADHDIIISLDGNDMIDAGAGNDTINGGQGRDKINAGAGHDSIRGDDDYWNGARDVISGGAGRDTIEGGPGNDKIIGGAGDDDIWDAVGRDTLVFRGKSGHDLVYDVDNNGMDLNIIKKKEITVTFVSPEGAYDTGNREFDYFDRGFLIEWGRNSVLINTYAELSEFGLEDYTFLG